MTALIDFIRILRLHNSVCVITIAHGYSDSILVYDRKLTAVADIEVPTDIVQNIKLVVGDQRNPNCLHIMYGDNLMWEFYADICCEWVNNYDIQVIGSRLLFTPNSIRSLYTIDCESYIDSKMCNCVSSKPIMRCGIFARALVAYMLISRPLLPEIALMIVQTMLEHFRIYCNGRLSKCLHII